MNARENKALFLAAVALVLLGQPAFARGGGFGGGYGDGFAGSTHGFGGIGVHGFSGGFTPSTHSEGKADSDKAGDRANNSEKQVNNAEQNRASSYSPHH